MYPSGVVTWEAERRPHQRLFFWRKAKLTDSFSLQYALHCFQVVHMGMQTPFQRKDPTSRGIHMCRGIGPLKEK
jgi:hypothetical protein